MNNDYLRINSKTEDQNIAVSEFKNEIKNEEVEKPTNLNLFTLLSFSKSKSGFHKIKAENLPSFKGLLAILLIYAAATILLTFISFLTSDVTMLLFTAAFASLMFPLFLLLFFYNLNTAKTTNFIEIITGTTLGTSLFVALNLLDVYLDHLIKYNWFKNMVGIIIRDIVLFISASLFVKIAKKDNLFDALLLSVALYAGYLFTHSLDVMINSLFINADVTVPNQETIVTSVIMLSEEGYKAIILSFLDAFINQVVFTSLIIGCSSIINGGVIGLNVSPLKDDGYREWSLYVLFFITVVLHLGASFPSSIRTFSILLKASSAIFLAILAIMIINYYLSKIHVNKAE